MHTVKLSLKLITYILQSVIIELGGLKICKHPFHLLFQRFVKDYRYFLRRKLIAHVNLENKGN